MKNSVSLGQRIRQLRMQKGLTQVELSKGISTPSMVSQVEGDRARPSYKLLVQFAARLDISIDFLLSDVELNLQMTSKYKMARAMVRSREYEAAIPLLLELKNAPESICSQQEIMFVLAECYLHIGQGDHSEPYLKTLQQRAQMWQDHHLLSQIGYFYGLLEFERKHYQFAVHEWLKAIESLDKMTEPDYLLKQRLLIQLGNAHAQLGMMGEAVPFYDQAAQLLKETDNMHELGTIYSQMAKSFMRAGDWAQVGQYAQKAEAIFDTLDHIVMKWRLQMDCAIAYGQTGREEEAALLLEEALVKFEELGKVEEKGIAWIELAKVRLQLGEVVRAEEAAHTARAVLPELHVYQAWVHRVLGRIANERKQHDAAIRHFEKAADCFKNMGEFGEWEATMFDLSRLYREQQNPDRALGILESLRNFTKKVLGERGIVL